MADKKVAAKKTAAKAGQRQDPADAKKIDTAVKTEQQPPAEPAKAETTELEADAAKAEPEPVQEVVPDDGARQHTALGVTYNVTDDKGFRRA